MSPHQPTGRLPQVVADLMLNNVALEAEAPYGPGVPAAILADAAGRFYFRTDTPTIANQRIYVSTAAGVWVGIA